VTPLKITLAPGQLIFDQVVFAAKKAFLSGALRPGDPFPSVRSLAVDLKIHPNTAHKAVQFLIRERWLAVQPGIGTIVAEPPKARAVDRKRVLKDEADRLAVEAKRVGAGLDEVIQAVSASWQDLEQIRKAGGR
jgi:DNA-binding transcriptional regulator YhcF (GntR family)